MPCPFGYKAEDGDEGENADVASGEEDEIGEEGVAKEKTVKPKAKVNDADRFNFEKDPVSWFYQNQIKSEEEYQGRRKRERQAAKGRLQNIMAAKNKQLEFEADLDDASIHSSELSELDSDVHSLSSLRSCAESWIEDAEYKAPAEGWVKFAAPAALAVTGYCLYQSYTVMSLCSKVAGVVQNPQWAIAGLALGGTAVPFLGLMYYSATKRSKRLLLCSQVGLLLIYTLAALLSAFMYAQPTMIDAKLYEGTCSAKESKASGSRTCSMMSKVDRQFAEAVPPMVWSCAGVGLAALALVGLGIWYVFEIAYIEKKAAKHKKRHRRHKHTIPWHKIKIVGPVTNCGSGGAKPAGGAKGASGGKCPVMH